MSKREYRITGGKKDEVYILDAKKVIEYFKRAVWQTTDKDHRKFLICLEQAALDGIGNETIKEVKP
jgi:hypothetical protein